MGRLDPAEDELARYVRERLAGFGSPWAEPDIVDEALSANHDLWLRLYEIDLEFGPAPDPPAAPA
ncbi:MAG TPA: hypothetical protein VM290_10085 [Gaiellaceae bacterium]|nr:hypothetical protein [Gaiellaceae bacterium]